MIQELNYELSEGSADFPAFRIYSDTLKIQVYFQDITDKLSISVKESTEETGDYVTVEDSQVEIPAGASSHLYTWLNAKRKTWGLVSVSGIAGTGKITRIVIKQ